MGSPTDKDQYVHRVGRTGRAGKDGHGVLILNNYESKFLSHSLNDLTLDVLDSQAFCQR
eukprot:Awhi_evm1s6494